MHVRPREVSDQAAARAFLARHNSLPAARLGELVHPMDYPALVAETAGGQLLGMLTYVPGQDWRQATPKACGWRCCKTSRATQNAPIPHYNKLDPGGHFAAWEQPDVFSAEMRAAFRSLRKGRLS